MALAGTCQISENLKILSPGEGRVPDQHLGFVENRDCREIIFM
jgi:hypothetical protein